MPPFLIPKNNNCILHIWLIPNAKENKLYGLFNGYLKLYIASPAVEGKANKALIAYLADLFKLRKNQITFLQGEKAHQKTLLLETPAETVLTCLSQHIPL